MDVETIANLVRAIVNDMLQGSAGEILTDLSPLLFPMLNDSLEWFTNELNNHGVDSFVKETLLLSVTANPTDDPGTEVFIDDSGYFDGQAASVTPQLPTDLLTPLRLWERETGSTENWVPMQGPIMGGLPSIQQSSRLGFWEWRQDGIYMPGATQTNDIRLRYNGSQGILSSTTDILYYRGAAGPIAYKTASTYLLSKNPAQAQLCAAEAMSRLGQLTTRNSRMKQRQGVSRQSYGSPSSTARFIPPHN